MPDSTAPASELGLRARKKARLRAQIADTALDLIRSVGLERTTVDEICRRVEISQPTFYKYYPGKDAILAEHAMIGWGELTLAALDAPGSLEKRLRACIAVIAERMQADGRLWHAIAVSGAYNPVRDPVLLQSNEAGTRSLERLLAQGQERAELTSDFAADRLASMLEGVLLRVGIEWGAGALGSRPLGAAMAEAVEFFLRAARATPHAGSTRGSTRKPASKGASKLAGQRAARPGQKPLRRR